MSPENFTPANDNAIRIPSVTDEDREKARELLRRAQEKESSELRSEDIAALERLIAGEEPPLVPPKKP